MRSTSLSAVRRPVHLTPRSRTVLGAAVLVACLMPASLPGPVVQASLGTCYDDPVAVLSNGVTVDLYATTYDIADDIKQVAFTLHAPTGTSLVSVVYTSGVMGTKEVLYFYANNTSSDAYNITTMVSTKTSQINVAASTTVVPPVDPPASASASGHSNQKLQMAIIV